MANSTVTGWLYEYELVGAPADDPMLGIKYVGQSCEPSLPPDLALDDRDKKHLREAKSHPNKPISRVINSYGKAALKGPIRKKKAIHFGHQVDPKVHKVTRNFKK